MELDSTQSRFLKLILAIELLNYIKVNICSSRYVLTGSPLMSHLISAAGFELADVQLTSTLSPSEYLSLPPVINGPFFGNTRKKSRPLGQLRSFFQLIQCLQQRLMLFCHSFYKNTFAYVNYLYSIDNLNIFEKDWTISVKCQNSPF